MLNGVIGTALERDSKYLALLQHLLLHKTQWHIFLHGNCHAGVNAHC